MEIIKTILSVDYIGLFGAVCTALGAVVATILAVGAIFVHIPGEQPEKAIFGFANKIKKFAEWVSTFSKKKND